MKGKQGQQKHRLNRNKGIWGCSPHCNKLLYNKMIIIYDINIIIYVWGHIMKNILSIYQNWKKKRQERKQADLKAAQQKLSAEYMTGFHLKTAVRQMQEVINGSAYFNGGGSSE